MQHNGHCDEYAGKCRERDNKQKAAPAIISRAALAGCAGRVAVPERNAGKHEHQGRKIKPGDQGPFRGQYRQLETPDEQEDDQEPGEAGMRQAGHEIYPVDEVSALQGSLRRGKRMAG